MLPFSSLRRRARWSFARRLICAVLAVGSSCALLASARAETLRVRVEAGDFDRADAPVSLRLERDWDERLVAGVLADDKMQPAQLMPSEGGKAEVVWILDRLEKGKSAVVEIRLGPTFELPEGIPTFGWKDSSGEHGRSMDLRLGEQPVLRYFHTAFDAKDIELTKKPFHGVFAPGGDGFLTKGAGGLYPHHRGIYFGYNKCRVGSQSFDTWHAQKGEHQNHVEVLRKIEGPVAGGHVVRIDWNDREGKAFARERRTLLAYAQPQGQQLIELRTHLETVDAEVDLDGDPQHAGVQFRSAQEVADHSKDTRYLRPDSWKDLPEDKEVNWPNNAKHTDLPWNAIRIRVGGKPYTVAYLSAPSNPDGARASERLYGRFGEFIPWKLTQTAPLELTYRWWITSSHETSREDVEARYQALASPPKATLLTP